MYCIIGPVEKSALDTLNYGYFKEEGAVFHGNIA